MAWQLTNLHLDQLIDLHCFLREAKQLENVANAQEASLSTRNFGETVEEVLGHFKKHEAFEKLTHAQDERLLLLSNQGDKLIKQNHFEAAQIASKLADIKTKRIKIEQMCDKRRVQLEDALLYAEFTRDVGDAVNWIAERQKKLEAEMKLGDASNFEEKVKKLQRHQAFQAEVAANENKMQEIQLKGEKLLNKRHEASPEIHKMLNKLIDAWLKLVRDVNLQGKGLEEARDILEFNNQLDKIEAWIRDKEIMIQAGDTGRDYEHCQALQRKLDDVDSDMRVDDARIKSINVLAEKLIRQGREGVKERRDNFVKKWHDLQGSLNKYRQKLAGALEIHLFNRDIDDTSQRIGEKVAAMDVEEVGKDLKAVQVLQRKQDTVEREISAVQIKMQEHVMNAKTLRNRYPDHAHDIAETLEGVKRQWENLLEMRKRRRNALEGSYTRQRFFAELKDLGVWVSESVERMKIRNRPTSAADAVALLELHNEHKAEIDGRQKAFKDLHAYGTSLIRSEDDEIIDSLKELEDLHKTLTDAWARHEEDLTHEYEIQEFKEQADQLENWFASKEAFLNNDDTGDNTRAVEALLRKQQDFETTLGQQLNRVTELEKMGNKITSDARYDNTEVKKYVDTMTTRRDRLLESANARRDKLEESRALHEFHRNVIEVESWLMQKSQVANDENYREPSNLQSKMQRHVAFDAEILANETRVNAVVNEGQYLIDGGHFASEEIGARLEDLENDWKQLKADSSLKRDRLNDAYQALLFGRSLDEFEAWLDEVEQQLSSSDTGKDLATVNNLLNKHGAFEKDIRQHEEICETIHGMTEQFVKSDHFMADELQMRAQDAITRFHRLQEPLESRKDALESSLTLHQFTRDVDDEIQWLLEKEPLAASTDLGE